MVMVQGVLKYDVLQATMVLIEKDLRDVES